MSLTRMWTHGNSLVVEDPGEYAYIRHRGWGTELAYALPRDDEDPQNLSLRTCHIPIPTPALVDGEVPWLTKIYVPYETSSDMYIARAVIWDANSIVHTWEWEDGALLARGSHLELDASNQLTVPNPQPVNAGLSLALQVQLYVTSAPGDSPGVEPPLDPWILTVSAVGADFVYPRAPLSVYTGYRERIADSAATAVKERPAR